MVKALLLIVFLLLALPADAVPVTATATWGAPGGGSPAVRYVVQVKTDSGQFATYTTVTTTSAVLTLESGHTYIVRVAGVDARDRQGPWSAESEPWTPDLGPPTAPTKPTLVQQ